MLYNLFKIARIQSYRVILQKVTSWLFKWFTHFNIIRYFLNYLFFINSAVSAACNISECCELSKASFIPCTNKIDQSIPLKNLKATSLMDSFKFQFNILKTFSITVIRQDFFVGITEKRTQSSSAKDFVASMSLSLGV